MQISVVGLDIAKHVFQVYAADIEGRAVRRPVTMSQKSSSPQAANSVSQVLTPDIVHKPRLLSDNGSSYLSGDLAEWVEDRGMGHVRGAPNHPQTQGKIERWHQTLKNRILLENYYLPGDLGAHIARFVERYNYRRYHESLSNLTPADVYCGRGETILLERERIKRQTFSLRRMQHQQQAA